MTDQFERFFYLCAIAIGILIFVYFVKNRLAKIFSLFACFFLFVFCGVGYWLIDIPINYASYFAAYILAFLFPFVFLKQKNNFSNHDLLYQKFLDNFIVQTSGFIITAYLSLSLLELLVNGKIYNLFIPPSPDVFTQFRARMSMEQGGIILLIIKNFTALLFPFYLLSLYKYKKNICKMILFYMLPVYIDYCQNCYIGRCAIFGHLTVVLGIIFVYKPQWRKTLILLIPLMCICGIFFSVFYFNYRSGGDLTLAESVLFEIGLCDKFENCVEFHYNNLGRDYLFYILNLPFPSYLKMYQSDFNFSVIFSELYLNLERTNLGFYVLLSGVVNEGVFLLGTKYFWIHGLVSGIIFASAVKCCNISQKTLLFLYLSFIISSFFARAGCVPAYPFVLKQLLVMELVLTFLFYLFKINKGQILYE